jgi:hypothetical protein
VPFYNKIKIKEEILKYHCQVFYQKLPKFCYFSMVMDLCGYCKLDPRRCGWRKIFLHGAWEMKTEMRNKFEGGAKIRSIL